MTLEAAPSPRVSRVTRVNDVSKSRRVRLPSKYSIDARPSGPVRTVSPSRSDMPSCPVAKAPLPRWTPTCPSRRRRAAPSEEAERRELLGGGGTTGEDQDRPDQQQRQYEDRGDRDLEATFRRLGQRSGSSRGCIDSPGSAAPRHACRT